MRSSTVALGLIMVVSCSLLMAQGRKDYFNVESPQVKPITVARIGGHDYVLVCDTPDNSFEIWDTDESLAAAMRFKARVRVGLEPVSVKWNPTLGYAYTTNFLGDSISVVSLTLDANGLKVSPIMTRAVGDEPMDIAFSADNQSLFVTHNTLGTFGWRNAATLDPVAPIMPLTDMAQIDLVEGSTSLRGIKEPRAVAVSAGKLFVLGFKGGNTNAYDFDVYVRDLATQAVAAISGLGSTNYNMTFAANGDLWVVGGEAQNVANATESAVAAEPTGFVRSTIYVVQAGGGATIARDLNDQDGNHTPVAQPDALAQPTDVVTYEPAGGAMKVFLAAFGSDRVGVLTPNLATQPYTWPLARIAIPTTGSWSNVVSGPRGLAIKYANAGDQHDPGDRLYVMDRLDNSLAIIDPANNQLLEAFPLHNDPTPDYIRTGRKFLYSAAISGSGFVSCASCHMDGRTDSLQWKLGTPTMTAPPYPAGLADGVAPPTTFQADKGGMVTQTLQGLLNYEVERSIQGFFTNAPHHWRGDKADFTDFNIAFVNLMGAPPQVNGNGLSDTDMLAYRTFVHSIQYPPNPMEPDTREFSGKLGKADDESDGFGAARGLKLFHTHPIQVGCLGRSCVQCHFLPEGSNNRGTDPTGGDIIETAATRGLFQREARLDKSAGPVSAVVTAEFGLTHLGLGIPVSLNGFINRFNSAFAADELLAVKQFMREFDFGVAPLVGRAYTVTAANKSSTDTGSTLDLFESQARLANVGVAVQARIGGVDSGWWLDLTQTPLLYQKEDLSASLSRAALLALATGSRDRMVFIATPLGSDRRVASVTGTTVPLTGAAPSGLELRPAVPNTAYEKVPTLTSNWDPDPTVPFPFFWTGASATPSSIKAIRIMQQGLIVDGQGQYGLTARRHEAPRRFVVAGSGIRPGAVLRLLVPDSTVAPNPTGTPGQIQTVEFALPIYPTDQTLADGRRIWQTAVEADAALIYTMMLGGRLAPGVPSVLDPLVVSTLPEHPVGMFDPDHFNWHYVKVTNADGTEGNGSWQRLTLQ